MGLTVRLPATATLGAAGRADTRARGARPRAGLEFHGSLFVSNPPYQSSASEDKDVFDSTGTDCNSYVPPRGQPGNLGGTSIPYTCPIFSTTFAASYHTYKLIWTHSCPATPPRHFAWLARSRRR